MKIISTTNDDGNDNVAQDIAVNSSSRVGVKIFRCQFCEWKSQFFIFFRSYGHKIQTCKIYLRNGYC
jgi:hypothetical protein